MAMGRGSAKMSFGVAFICLLVLQQCFVISHAAVYNVGDNNGWTFNTVNWPRGKSFKAGDVLVFKYDRTMHNTVAVSAAGYRGCTTPGGSKVYNSGNDRITLVKGTNYFICSFTGHCLAGMKIAVTAS
ncbi:Cupredoxins domain-containing protein [Dioscorea alata]|uniref:Cupredoxins domain-containing protein n=1 Tax=Dioscorea alata TaxID=55571 RepID=A0ACB7VYB4_DIOAL|nr:Cupredoxins domain-containing protein [Dioscorea alata]